MICPVCSAVIDDDTEICPECGTPIQVIESEDKKHPWVLVYTTSTEMDAEMFKNNLESAGIETQLLSQVDSTRNFTMGELAIVKIFVKSSDVEEAVEIIRSIENDTGARTEENT